MTQSAWRNASGAAVGGVGVLLSPFARKVLVSVWYVSPRIMKVTLNGNPQTTILVTYAPTNVADEEETINYYNSLIEITGEIPAHNFLTVIGDFNARIGRDSAKFTYHETTVPTETVNTCWIILLKTTCYYQYHFPKEKIKAMDL